MLKISLFQTTKTKVNMEYRMNKTIALRDSPNVVTTTDAFIILCRAPHNGFLTVNRDYKAYHYTNVSNKPWTVIWNAYEKWSEIIKLIKNTRYLFRTPETQRNEVACNNNIVCIYRDGYKFVLNQASKSKVITLSNGYGDITDDTWHVMLSFDFYRRINGIENGIYDIATAFLSKKCDSIDFLRHIQRLCYKKPTLEHHAIFMQEWEKAYRKFSKIMIDKHNNVYLFCDVSRMFAGRRRHTNDHLFLFILSPNTKRYDKITKRIKADGLCKMLHQHTPTILTYINILRFQFEYDKITINNLHVTLDGHVLMFDGLEMASLFPSANDKYLKGEYDSYLSRYLGPHDIWSDNLTIFNEDMHRVSLPIPRYIKPNGTIYYSFCCAKTITDPDDDAYYNTKYKNRIYVVKNKIPKIDDIYYFKAVTKLFPLMRSYLFFHDDQQLRFNSSVSALARTCKNPLFSMTMSSGLGGEIISQIIYHMIQYGSVSKYENSKCNERKHTSFPPSETKHFSPLSMVEVEYVFNITRSTLIVCDDSKLLMDDNSAERFFFRNALCKVVGQRIIELIFGWDNFEKPFFEWESFTASVKYMVFQRYFALRNHDDPNIPISKLLEELRHDWHWKYLDESKRVLQEQVVSLYT